MQTFEERVVPSTTTWIGGSLNGFGQWTGGSPTAWSNPLNWSNGMPGTGDTALFSDNVSETYTNIGTGQPFTHTGPQNSDGVVDVPFSVAGVTLDNSWTGAVEALQPLTLTGTSSWSSGTILVDLGSTLTNNATLNISSVSGGVTLSESGNGGGGTFINNGTINEQAGGDLFIGPSVELDNTASGFYDFQADVNIQDTNGGSGSMLNAGTIEKTGGTGTSTINLALSSSNAITVQTGTLALATQAGAFNLVNTGGTFTVSSGATLDLTGGKSVIYGGTYTASGGGTVLLGSGQLNVALGGATFDFPASMFQWTGGILNASQGSLTNTGTLNVAGNGQVLTGGASLVNQGTINETGTGSLFLDSGVTVANQANAVYDFQSDSSLGGTNSGGVLANAGTVKKTGGTGTSVIDDNISNAANLTVQSGTLALHSRGGLNAGGSFTVASGATLDLTDGSSSGAWSGTYTGSGAGTVLLGNGQLNVGLAGAAFDFPGSLFQWTGGTLNLTGVTLTNTGTLNFVSNGQILTGGSNGALVNQATINETGTGSLFLDSGVTLENTASGAFDFQSDCSLGGTNSAGLVANAGIIEKTGGTGVSQIDNGIDNAANLTVQTGTLALHPRYGLNTGGVFTASSGATLDLTDGSTSGAWSGTYTGSGAGTVLLGNGQLNVGLTGTTFDLPGNLFQWIGGTLNVGVTHFTNTGTMNIVGNGQNVVGAGSLLNKKLIIQSGANNLTLPGGSTLMNAAGATYDLVTDVGFQGAGAGVGSVINAGILEKTKSTGTSQIGVFLSNTGTVKVLTGTLQTSSSIAQLSGGVLTGGTWMATGTAKGPASLNFNGQSLNALGSKTKITLTGAGASFSNLSSLATIENGATLSLLSGATLTTNGALTDAGSLTLGTGSVLTVSGSFTEQSSGFLTIDLGGTTSAPTFGQLVSTSGTVTLDGSLKVASTVVPAVGSSFEILDNAGGSAISGTFAGLPEGSTFPVKKSTTTMTFKITYAGTDADDSDNVIITRIS